MATYRLDTATGRRVLLLAYTPDGYARVRTLGSGSTPGFTFETLATRLFRPLTPLLHL